MSLTPEPTHETEITESPGPGALPPEVEAELRRRQTAAPAQEPLAPWLQPALDSPPETSAPPAQPSAAAPHPGKGNALSRLGPIGVLLATLLKYAPFLLKFGLVALKTGGTMLVSIWFYALIFGWWFAVGFVLCILVHELGHVFVAWRMGVPASAPIFIPGMGALILQKGAARSAWDQALIGIGGPVAGTIAGLVCLLAYQATGSRLMLGLAYTSFFINLFNLAPVVPLDGGWITGAISPRIWLVGMVGMLVAFLTGQVRNPMILVLLFLSFPRLWRGLTTGEAMHPGAEPTTPQQRMQMGLAYVGLAGLLVWLTGLTHQPL
jgi:Zn-dependent protease